MSVQNDYTSLLAVTGDLYEARFANESDDNFTYEATWGGKKIFQVSHEEMVRSWKASDDQMILFKEGICQACVLRSGGFLPAPGEVVIQEGALRFGGKVGFCFPCIHDCFKGRRMDWLTTKMSFKDSDDIHEFSVTLDKLQNLLEHLKKDQSPPQEQVGILQYIIEQNTATLEQVNRELQKPMQCKKCRKLVMGEKSFTLLDEIRKAKNVTGACLGCGLFISLVSGCSIATCEFCVTHTKTCVVCMDGATEMAHQLQMCSEIMSTVLKKSGAALPNIQSCACNMVDQLTNNFAQNLQLS